MRKINYLKLLLYEYWFAPQDVLLRSVEANIWQKLAYKHPILDIGIGDGGISKFLFPKNIKIDVGIDLDKSGLHKATKTGVYKKVLAANAENLPFVNASFATVVSNSTFEHILHDTKAISEVGRVLKKGGHFFLTVPSEYLPKMILEIDGERELLNFNKRVRHLHYRSLVSWKTLLEKNNLKIVSHTYYFPSYATRLWYRLFKISVSKWRKREFWSYLAHSRFTKFIPKRLVIYLLSQYMRKAYIQSLSAKETGSMQFIVAQKIS